VPVKIDLINKIFGSLKVIKETNKRSKSGSIVWQCQCSCGSIVNVTSNNLSSGNTKQCRSCASKTHGKTKSKSYVTWKNIKNKQSEWDNYKSFYNDMKDPIDYSYTLVKLDKNKPYSKANCEWRLINAKSN
jgi:hypothetical protein